MTRASTLYAQFRASVIREAIGGGRSRGWFRGRDTVGLTVPLLRQIH